MENPSRTLKFGNFRKKKLTWFKSRIAENAIGTKIFNHLISFFFSFLCVCVCVWSSGTNKKLAKNIPASDLYGKMNKMATWFRLLMSPNQLLLRRAYEVLQIWIDFSPPSPNKNRRKKQFSVGMFLFWKFDNQKEHDQINKKDEDRKTKENTTEGEWIVCKRWKIA